MDIGFPEHNEPFIYYSGQEEQGKLSKSKSKKPIFVKAVYYQQTYSIVQSSDFSIALTRETLSAGDAILTQ